MIYFDSDTEKIELVKHIAPIETENRMLKEQLASRNKKLPSRNETMIKYFENGNKEKLKLVLEEVFRQNTEQMSDDELVFCYIAKTLDSLGNFCEIAESAETELASRILKIENTLKHASSFDEFKAFCLEGSDDE